MPSDHRRRWWSNPFQTSRFEASHEVGDCPELIVPDLLAYCDRLVAHCAHRTLILEINSTARRESAAAACAAMPSHGPWT